MIGLALGIIAGISGIILAAVLLNWLDEYLYGEESK
jgi:ABC-type lipoprotein release transport system permease subunit